MINLKDGDLIFQTSESPQSEAIQAATGSPYSHCGIIYKNGDKFFVYEAYREVETALISDWIKRGKDKKFVTRRLKDATQFMTPKILGEMKEVGNSFNGKAYDKYFEWGNDSLYCSELIWKIYKAVGKEIGKTQLLKDLDLSKKVVKDLMHERYGNDIPLYEIVITPKAVFESDLLETIENTFPE